MDLWLTRLAVIFSGDKEKAKAEATKFFPYIASWELSENDTEFEISHTGVIADGFDSANDKLIIAAGAGFSPPVSQHELRRLQFKGTGNGGNVKLTIYLSDEKIDWAEGIL
jgi:hypothetical protein